MSQWRYALSAAPQASSSAPILLVGDICTCLKQAAALGYDAIEYHTRETAEIPYCDVLRTMEETGCRISMIVTGRIATEGGLHLVSADPAKEAACVSGFYRYIDIASRLGAGIVIGWAKGNADSTEDLPRYYQRLARNLESLDRYAAEKNVPIMIEVINHYEVNVFDTAKSLMAFLQAYPLPNCYAHLDTFHMMVEEPDIANALDTVGDRLGYFHFADYGRYYPGSGGFDFAQVLGKLKQLGYNGYLSVECKPGADRLKAASEGLRHLRCLEQALDTLTECNL